MPKFCGLCGGAAPKYDNNGVPSDQKEIPHDPLEQSLCDATELEVFFNLIESYGQELSGILARLKQIPGPLIAGFERYCSKGSDGEDVLWEKFSTQVNMCTSRVTDSMSHLERLVQLVKNVRPRFTVIGQVREERQQAWTVKVQQEEEVEKLKKGRAVKLEKKSAQMHASMEAADKFQGCTNNLERVLNDLLSQQSSTVATAITAFNDCFAGIFHEESPDMRPDMKSTNNQFPNESGDFVLASIGSSAAPHGLVSPRPAPVPAASTVKNNKNGAKESIAPIATAGMKYVVGEKVEVWSSSQQKWLEGIVIEVFEKGGMYEDYYVPAGVVKVESDAGTKFIQPEHMHDVLRKFHT